MFGRSKQPKAPRPLATYNGADYHGGHPALGGPQKRLDLSFMPDRLEIRRNETNLSTIGMFINRQNLKKVYAQHPPGEREHPGAAADLAMDLMPVRRSRSSYFTNLVIEDVDGVWTFTIKSTMTRELENELIAYLKDYL